MEFPYRLTKMTWQEIEERIPLCGSIIVPIGSVEQHGPALPLDNDHFIATRISELICEHLWPGFKLTLAPTIAFGHSPHHMDFKGTISLKETTLTNVIVDVCLSLRKHGFKNILLLNGHGGNKTAISSALTILHNEGVQRVFSADWWGFIMGEIPDMFSRPVFHACDMETSVAWALDQRVLEEKRVDEHGRSPYPGYVLPDMLSPPPKVSVATSMKEFTNSGVVGYSTRATMEKGEKAVQLVVERISDFIRSLETT
ncbi:MAG: creatininase family protein [Candidatus Thorarchaeota archaeon]